jgi:hypothetical protein
MHGLMHHLVLPLYADEANKPGYGQLYISDSPEATKKRLESQNSQGYMAK